MLLVHVGDSIILIYVSVDGCSDVCQRAPASDAPQEGLLSVHNCRFSSDVRGATDVL